MGLMRRVSDSIRGRRSNAAKVPDEEQAAELELGPYSGDDTSSASHQTITPIFPVPCLQPEAHKSSEIAPQLIATSKSIKIRVTVGTGAAKQTWLIDKELLCSFSEYFRGALDNSRFTEEASTGKCTLPEDDPDSFREIVEWLHLKDCCKSDGSLDHLCRGQQKAGRGLPEKHFVVADRFIMQLYCRFLLSHFIQDIERVGAERLKFVARNPITTVLIYRFARHWVAYLMFVQNVCSKDILQDKETRRKETSPKRRWWRRSSPCIQIASQRDLIIELGLEDAGWASSDPRKYGLDHWLGKCGDDIHADCEHRILRGVEGPKPKIAPPERRHNCLTRQMGLIIYLSPIIIIILASYIMSRDHFGFIPTSTKVLSIITSVSMIGCVAHPVFGVTSPILGLVTAIMTTMSTKTCFVSDYAAAEGVDICRLEAGLAGMVWLWTVTFIGLIYAI